MKRKYLIAIVLLLIAASCSTLRRAIWYETKDPCWVWEPQTATTYPWGDEP